MYEVKDGARTFKFDGVLLSFSTSHRTGSHRWVEFSLYRTTGGQYILSRVGETTLYHLPDCVIAHRNGLRPTPRAALRADSSPCEICAADQVATDDVMQEVARYWAQVCESADAVVDSLYRYDEAGSRYLTGVARRLLEEASDIDTSVYDAYRVETIF